MPSAHRRHADWTLERIRREAAGDRPDTAKLADVILESRPHPEQGFRACLGILRLARHYGAERLEAACDRGARHRRPLLRLDPVDPQERPRPAAAPPKPQRELPLPDHANLRGSRYYH